MDIRVKQESLPTRTITTAGNKTIPSRDKPELVIDLTSSNEEPDIAENLDGDTNAESADRTSDIPDVVGEKTPTSPSKAIVALPAMPYNVVAPISSLPPRTNKSCKQFWKAGDDYEGGGASSSHWEVSTGGFDHVRVHPKFLHSNATSHKWALGAFAELLDNALDEVHSGATYVNVDMLNNKKDGTKMLLIEDNGGGMDPEKMRHCMSLGYSAKSKLANTIGQYGNGFKTSTMRLGADVIVFSRSSGKDGTSPTQSIGLLSYTFLKSTGKEDIVVPMLDYERRGSKSFPIVRSSVNDWDRNVETLVQWSPFASEKDLLRQFNLMKDHGTRIIIYNLWEDDEGMLELDFDTDPHDIQLRGVNRDEKNITMASQYPNSRHFLTYKHSLRSYVSILYLRIPSEFRIILRGRDVEHHNIVNDMMFTKEVTYKPKDAADGQAKYTNLSALVTIGFVKDAKHHIDVQGFNVYHKNRLIKPFWRIWNAAGSNGRGVIGVLEANFVEPAHDKQGFERTTVLSRLEARLVQMQKDYWRNKSHKIGYASTQGKKKSVKDSDKYRESSPDYDPRESVSTKKRTAPEKSDRGARKESLIESSNKRAKLQRSPAVEVTNSDDDDSDYDDSSPQRNATDKSSNKLPKPLSSLSKQDKVHHVLSPSPTKPRSGSSSLSQLEKEKQELTERLSKKEDVFLLLQEELRREKDLRKKLEDEVQKTKEELVEMQKEQCSLIEVFTQDQERRDKVEENLRNKLEEASNTIQQFLDEKDRGR